MLLKKFIIIFCIYIRVYLSLILNKQFLYMYFQKSGKKFKKVQWKKVNRGKFLTHSPQSVLNTKFNQVLQSLQKYSIW
jgi:hypothetical protein